MTLGAEEPQRPSSSRSAGATLALGAEGRVFDFADGAGRPVVTKTAFFAGFGWVMALEDGSHWAQFIDGSQMVATDTHVVSVCPEGDRSLLEAEGGSLREGGQPFGGGVAMRAEALLSLRDVL